MPRGCCLLIHWLKRTIKTTAMYFWFQLEGVARFLNGTKAEENVHIRFKVVDQNDNTPVFEPIQPGKVNELSPPG